MTYVSLFPELRLIPDYFTHFPLFPINDRCYNYDISKNVNGPNWRLSGFNKRAAVEQGGGLKIGFPLETGLTSVSLMRHYPQRASISRALHIRLAS